jgi:signal peptidase I
VADAENRLAETVCQHSSKRLAVCTAILVSLVAFGAFYQPVVVQGKSMLPSLRDGQVLLMDRQYYRFHRVKPDDIVIFHHGRDLFIKRVFATSGQMVYVVRTREGITSLIETAKQRDGMARFLRRRPVMGRLEAFRVPPHSAFVVGDNTNYSFDSRDFGPVPNEEIVGHVPSPPTGAFAPEDRCASAVRVAQR